jgi:hypothetical protein
MNFDDTARYLGPSQKLWPELFAPPSKVATKLCRRCHKVAVEGIRRYCGPCALKNKLASTCKSKWAKRRLNGRKTEIRPLKLRHLQKQKCQTAITTLRNATGMVFLPRDKGQHCLFRKGQRVSK